MYSYETSITKQRLSQFLKAIGMNNNQFVVKMGYAPTFLNSKSGISEEKLIEISKAFPNLSMCWLLRGEGEMLKQDTPYMEQPLEADSRNQFSNLKEAIQQGEIIEMMKRQMEQNEKIIAQLMKVIESNNMVIQSLQKEIETLREEDTIEVMSRNQYEEMKRYKASVPGMPRKFREALEGFEEV